MSDGTAIEWTDATWNPITGCTVHSAGCTNCYAMRLAGTRLRNHPSREGLTIDTKAGPVWNGKVRFNEEWLTQPLRWKRPRTIFVCAHGDLFHEDVPDAWIDRVFAVMAMCPQHRFQVLTKRADRMRAYFAARRQWECLNRSVLWIRQNWRGLLPAIDTPEWPLLNVWLGVSVEDQRAANERIPHLLATPAAIRFLSCEPLLGPIDLTSTPWDVAGYRMSGSLPDPGEHDDFRYWHHEVQALRWVIVGGESGPGARPMHPDWARSLRDQCAAAGVPFFFKQWGTVFPVGQTLADGKVWAPLCGSSFRAAKSLAGRKLDGVEHSGMPA